LNNKIIDLIKLPEEHEKANESGFNTIVRKEFNSLFKIGLITTKLDRIKAS